MSEQRPAALDIQTPGQLGAGQGGMFGGQNPLSSFADIVRIQGGMQSIQLQRQRMDAMAGLGQILATNPDPDTAFAAMRQSPYAAYVPEVLANMRLADQTTLAMSQTRMQMGNNVMSNFMNMLPELMQSPTYETGQMLKKRALDPIQDMTTRRTMEPLIDDYLHSVLDNTGNNTDTARNKIFGGLIHSDIGADKIAYAGGKPETLNLGYGMQPGWQAGIFGGGAFTPAGGIVPAGAPPGWRDVAGVPQAVPGIPPGAGAALPAPGGAPPPTPGTPPPTPGTTQPPPGPAAPPALPRVEVPTTQLRQIGWTQDSIKNISEHAKELNERVTAGGQLMQQVAEMKNAMDKVGIGPEQAWRAPLSDIAARVGARPDIVDDIAGGSLTARQELVKLFINSTMSQVRGQLPPGSRLNVMEWSAFSRANPNIEMQSDAVNRIFNFWQRQYNYNVAESNQLADYLSRGNDPAKWPSEWSSRARAQGFFSTEPGVGQQPRGARKPLGDIFK